LAGFTATAERSGAPETWARMVAFSEAHDRARQMFRNGQVSLLHQSANGFTLPDDKFYDECINVKTGASVTGPNGRPPRYDEFRLK